MMRSQHHLRFTRGNMITSSEVMQSIKREKELRIGVCIFIRISELSNLENILAETVLILIRKKCRL